MQTNIRKLGPKTVYQRNYKNLINELFRQNLVNQLLVNEGNTNDQGSKMFFKICGEVCSPKEKICQTKPVTLSKEVMKRIKLKNRFLKNSTEENQKNAPTKKLLCIFIKKNKAKQFQQS